LPPQQLQNPTANYVTPADRSIVQLLRGGGGAPRCSCRKIPK
jgi:hypothetical protein